MDARERCPRKKEVPYRATCGRGRPRTQDVRGSMQQRASAVLAEMFAGQRKGHNATRHVCYNVALSQRGDCLAVEVVIGSAYLQGA